MSNDSGFAVMTTMLVMVGCVAVGLSLASHAALETRVGAAFRDRHLALALAETGFSRGLQDLRLAANWNDVLAGEVGSTLQGQGALPGIAGWDALAIDDLTAQVQRASDRRDWWGADAPRWRLYGWGRAGDLDSSWPDRSPWLVVLWVADEPGEGDGNPEQDADGRIQLRAEALGPARTRLAVVGTVQRRAGVTAPASWRLPSQADR